MNKNYFSSRSAQEGAALITALVMLVLLTMLGLTSMNTTTLEERMSANAQDLNRAFQAASTGLEIVFNDEAAFDTRLTADTDGTANDLYDKNNTGVGGTGSYAYNAVVVYNSVFREGVAPPRDSGWGSDYAYYHFALTADGCTVADSSATSCNSSISSSSLHYGAYQVGLADTTPPEDIVEDLEGEQVLGDT